ncbi:MAG: aminomethyl-transferring glycine dehydrogenase subunit GcvPB [Spirochaetes bacterium]|nr:aminomethyl-transferring glycine dehydrogenase subunit GcvPB [Spirochaetota bacterium]
MKDPNIIFEKNNSSLSFPQFKLENEKQDVLKNIPDTLLRDDLDDHATYSENEVVRHFVNLGTKNFGVDSGYYPLGSCTMKYNPKLNERVSSLESFTKGHPHSHPERMQGNLAVMYHCKESLLKITGMDDLTLAPAAGAHGELTGLHIIHSYFEKKGENRPYILIPDSAHGTNPASATMAGFKCMTVKSDKDDFIDLEDLKSKVTDEVAGLMLTNPNTIGIFEHNLAEIVDICHAKDVQLYYDGANLNALLGLSRPGDTGFDVVHLNLHKTFSTPHGGGGPGSGPVGVKKHLQPFLPEDELVCQNDKYFFSDRGDSKLGKMRSFYNNYLIVLRAYCYIVSLGKEGLRQTGLMALLNANYLAALLKGKVEFATDQPTMHEFVITLSNLFKSTFGDNEHLTIMDFAKRILDYGYHAPTVSFPLIVPDCLMIEPTETESKQTLDDFAAAILTIVEEAKNKPELLKAAPINTPVKRINDVAAARKPILQYQLEEE